MSCEARRQKKDSQPCGDGGKELSQGISEGTRKLEEARKNPPLKVMDGT